ncbi:MAG: hypothetical protein AB200_01135 [Parcubacteria bacterium C7867-005]|nr:MAG: hypothetical protein AB200_01135 [Parcubacteria bacterium C7867-005]
MFQGKSVRELIAIGTEESRKEAQRLMEIEADCMGIRNHYLWGLFSGQSKLRGLQDDEAVTKPPK